MGKRNDMRLIWAALASKACSKPKRIVDAAPVNGLHRHGKMLYYEKEPLMALHLSYQHPDLRWV